MKIPIALASLLSLSLMPFTSNAQDEGFKPLFNGTNLDGWDGNPALWSIADGVVTGKTKTPEDLKYNEFLIWRGGTVKNFELKAKIKVEGNNSGIQYRSKELPEVGKWVISGYQCDVHPTAENNAMMYHEKGRGIIAKNGQDVVVDPDGNKWLVAERDAVAVDTAKWHEYTIIAKGNQFTHKVDGKVTAHIIDHDKAGRSMKGLLALQIHRGPAMTVQVKDLMMKVLPDGGNISYEKTNIPNDAQIIEKPAPKGKGKGKGAPKAMPKGKGKAVQAKAKAKAKPKRAQTVGPRVGQNFATPVDRIKALPGFEVELLYSVPGGDQGSWVALCSDPNGRVYASDQYGDLYSFDPPAAGKTLSAGDVKKLPVNIRAINGMVFHKGAIWAGVNDYEKKIESGLYKISDSDGNGELDKVELLRGIVSSGDHGVHAVVPIPNDGGFFLITGNNADPVQSEDSSPVAEHWADDHLLPRMPDGRGHNRSRLAPGGIIYKVSPDGKKFERFASGFRNIYGGDLNCDGELFTYDADMEYDFNTPWYRPTRVNHVVSGGEYGWRNGAGKYPEFFPDTVSATLNIGPGSPTGTRFGYGAKFPAKYQNAFYVLDWSWGKLYAVHLTPDGASYSGTKEDFITGAPLPITDLIIHPKDGAMYFAIGGRRVQSGLYRVTYAGDEDTTAAPNVSTAPNKATLLRRELEKLHGKQDPTAVAKAWEHLDHVDRHVRWAARIILEHQPASDWEEKALNESNLGKQLPALMTLARVSETGPAHREQGAKVDAETRDKILKALLKIDYAKLSHQEKLVHVRTIQIALHRAGDPNKDTTDGLIRQLDPALPADNFQENWLLLETLAHLQAPNTARKGMVLIASAIGQEQQLQHARSLRFLKTGWTPELREAQLNWFLKASNYKGGASFDKFIEFIRNDTLATFTDAEKKQHAELIAKKAEKKSAIENVGAAFIGRTPKMWTLDELSAASKKKGAMSGRDFVNGRKMFSAAACYACHRFENEGGMTGPDLTGSGGRYSPHDLLDQIINPSKEINEQFAPIVVTKNNGEVASGVVVNLSGDNVTLNTDVSNPNQRVNIDRKEVKSLEVSKVSPMPPMLLSMLTEDEVMDLVAFILSGGDKNNEMFKK